MKNDTGKRRSGGRTAPPIGIAAVAARTEAAPPRAVARGGVRVHGVPDLAPKLQRPRLVVFVGAKGTPAPALAVLWFNALAAETKATVVLACADGAPRLSPELVAATLECGLDARRLIARTLTTELTAAADLVITISAGPRAAGRLPRGARRKEHWTIADGSTGAGRQEKQQKQMKGVRSPAARRATAGASRERANRLAVTQDAILDARKLRDTLRARVAMLVFSEGWGRPEISREEARVTPARPAPFPHGSSAGSFGLVRADRLAPPRWFSGRSLGA